MFSLDPALDAFRYTWPDPADGLRGWSQSSDGRSWQRAMPESRDALAVDSRWPAFFPSSMCLITTAHGAESAIEVVVGASIVNRFPYVVAFSLCTDALSARHHPRRRFIELLESGGQVALQWLEPGARLARTVSLIRRTSDADTTGRITRLGAPVEPGVSTSCPVLTDAYLVYEAAAVQPSRQVGSHRLFFFEIRAIQLREDIGRGQSQIRWRSLPGWEGGPPIQGAPLPGDGRIKSYTPDHQFPSRATVAFQWDEIRDGRVVRHFSPHQANQIELDNDRARWPCFFPSSAGIVSTRSRAGVVNLMPCGSTTVVSRQPMVIAPCISHAVINQRYAPRATLASIRETGRFGCGVPFIDATLVEAIRYWGNVSVADDPDKAARPGLDLDLSGDMPRLPALPVHFDCEVAGEIAMGTHVMFLGEVRRIVVHDGVTRSPLEWYPWPSVAPA